MNSSILIQLNQQILSSKNGVIPCFWILTFILSVHFAIGQGTIDYELGKYGSVEIILKEDLSVLKELLETPGIYLDHSARENHYSLVLNKKGFEVLKSSGYSFKHMPQRKSNLSTLSIDEIKNLSYKSNCMPAMDFYPSYEAYEQMMFDFQSSYPELCEVINIGTLDSERKIWVARIGSSLKEPERKPNFFYTSTMHGDEIVGYVFMLQLIDYLLCNYGSDEQVDHLVDNLNIYINPLANPDGTYRGGNHTVESSSRLNNSFVDLNRNFPDPKGGNNPDERVTQEETQIFMDFANAVKIHMSCNLHGGIELVNYPWDTFSERHADDEWFERISRDYADTVQSNSPEGYFIAFNNGITNGHDWVEIEGGRQDYHTFFKRGREVTLEVSDTKRLDAVLLPEFWEYNKKALLNYMQEASYGLSGKLTDCFSGDAVFAEVVVRGYDKQNSSVFSDPESGQYFRYLNAGNYEISYMAAGYDTITELITVLDKSTTVYDVNLCPSDMVNTEDNLFSKLSVWLSGNKILFDGLQGLDNFDYTIFDYYGRKLSFGKLDDISIDIPIGLSTGNYVIRLGNKEHFKNYRFFYNR